MENNNYAKELIQFRNMFHRKLNQFQFLKLNCAKYLYNNLSISIMDIVEQIKNALLLTVIKMYNV